LTTSCAQYIRKLSIKTQEKLAEANSIAEEALSSMYTVRSFACEEEEGGPPLCVRGPC
jgi:ABC-type multidrug transport system fused ATPase/permease subunit